MHRIILLFIFVCLWQDVCSQYKVDLNTETRFNDALSKQSAKQKKLWAELGGSFALVQKIEIDTLNKKDLKKGKAPDIVLISLGSQDTITKTVQTDFGDELQAMGLDAGIINDTLIIQTYFGFLSFFVYTIKIFDDTPSATYYATRESNYVSRKRPSKLEDNDIQLKVKIKELTFSKNPKQNGDTIYGKAILQTLPPRERNSDFKGGYIRTRETVTFLFIAKLVGSSNEANE